MKKDQGDKKLIGHKLRPAAEEQLADSTPPEIKAQTPEELLHELRVHQIELEMQNESLRQTQQALEDSRDRYIDLYEFAPVAYLTLSEKGLITQTNLTGVTLLGQERHKLINKNFRSLVISEDQNRWVHHFMIALDQKDNFTIELSLKHGNGKVFQAQLDCVRNALGLRITLSDITERKQAENNLRIAATTFESQEGIFVTDANSVIQRVNHAFSEITGYSAEDAIGQTPRLLSSARHDKAFYIAMWRSINNTGIWNGEIWNKRKTGEIYPEHLAITAVKDAAGNVANYVGSFTDITLTQAALDELESLAFFDPLTQLPNRRLLIDRLKQALVTTTRSGQRGGLLFIDLDQFKIINDTLGHDVGDTLLQQVSARLTANVRKGDTVVRIGGDEFVVLLIDLSKKTIDAAAQTKDIAEHIILSLNQPFQLNARPYYSTASLGATVFYGHEQKADELLKQSKIAMYQSKTKGGNTIHFFDPKMQQAIDDHADMEQELRKAIEHNQFQLYYQIQVDNNGQAFGAEALIRWLHPERGIISPFNFIPLAEKTGLILPIGQWVLDTACAQLNAWQHNPLTQDLILAVNVSAKQFHQEHFVEQVKETIQRHKINPARLKLELTESMLVVNINDIITKMDVLSKIGVHFSLDDFGTGYSSLQYLKKLPLYQLKIDKSFIDNLVSDSSDQAIVRTIIAMAHSLDLKVIAEGVETKEQQQVLLTEGCAHYQGYLFSKPVPIDEFELLLEKAE
ncbi:MAG: diguanylate cyclase (GGDEF)-like protein/PAS domain S-box-containing protein [Paraglaciecola sp.]|jgi:diguanylate cyclase (GGDEF)-like protein/PAS domain S-box-containing protein